MVIQWGNNPEYTLSVCVLCAWWRGKLALPVELSWWNSVDILGHKSTDITITFLCFHFGMERLKFGDGKEI